MIYQVIRTLLRWFMRFFYPRVFILHSDAIPKAKPFILVCNYQNSLMDAFVLAVQFNMPLHFIMPVRKKISNLMQLIMDSLHIVPLRKGWHRKSEEQFSNPWTNLRNLLTNNKSLVFFSETKAEQLKVTKGAAKIAFHTEEVFDFALDIEIIPVTINYRRQGEAVIILGDSVPVRSFEKDYKRYPARTIKYTTNYLETELCNGNDAEQVEFARLLGKFHMISERETSSGIDHSLSVKVAHPMNQALTEDDPDLLKDRLVGFFNLLEKYRINDWSPIKPDLLSFVITFLGAPLFILGHSVNWLRYQLSCGLSQLLLPGLRNDDSFKMIFGLLLFPLLWIVISIQVTVYLNSSWLGLLVMIALPLIAQFTYIYSQKSRRVFSYLKYRYYLKVHAHESRRIRRNHQAVSGILRRLSQTKVLSIR